MNNFTYLPRDNREFQSGRHYIGASDMPTLFGLNKKYGQTPRTLWEQLTGRAESFSGNSRTRAGHWHEDGILARYVHDNTDYNHTGFWISRLMQQERYYDLHSFTEARHPDYPYAVAHADLLQLDDTPVIVQAKNSGIFAAKRGDDKNRGYDKEDFSQNGVPLGVYLQEQWEMFCYGITAAYVTVEIDGWDWRIYGPITYHKKSVENCLALADRLWWHVEHDTPPEPMTWPDVCKMYPELEEGTSTIITGGDLEDVTAMQSQLKKIARASARLKEQQEDIQNAIGLIIGGAQVLRSEAGDEIAKAYISSGQWRADIKALRESHPRMYATLVKEGIIKQDNDSRMLSISGTRFSYHHRCKQCGADAQGGKTVKEGRKIIYGPFCRSCWERIKQDLEEEKK